MAEAKRARIAHVDTGPHQQFWPVAWIALDPEILDAQFGFGFDANDDSNERFASVSVDGEIVVLRHDRAAGTEGFAAALASTASSSECLHTLVRALGGTSNDVTVNRAAASAGPLQPGAHRNPAHTHRISQILTNVVGVAGAAAGDRQLRSEEIERYAWSCRGYVREALRSRGRSEFEDCAQEFLVEKLSSGYVFEKFVTAQAQTAGAKTDEGNFRFFLKRSLKNHVLSELRKRSVHLEPDEEVYHDVFASAEAEFDRRLLHSVIMEVLDDVVRRSSVDGREDRWRAFRDYWFSGGRAKWHEIDQAHGLEDGQAMNFGEAILGQIRQRLTTHPSYEAALEVYRNSSASTRDFDLGVNEEEIFMLDDLFRALDQEFRDSDLLELLKQFESPTIARNRYESIIGSATKPEKLKSARKFFRIALQKSPTKPVKLACEILVHAATARAETEFGVALSTIPQGDRRRRYKELRRRYPGLRVSDWFAPND